MPRDTAARLALSPPLLRGPTTGLAETHLLRAFHPVDEGAGLAFFADRLVAPLTAAFPQGEERTDIAMSGTFGGEVWLARSGHIAGRFEAPLFGIPATGQAAFVRFGRFERFVGEQIVETLLLLDLPALMMQSGCWPFAPPLGPHLIAPGPATRDGVAAASVPDPAGIQSLGIVESMIGGLMKFDGNLKTMGMRDWWTDDFWWFGPAPIGNFRGLDHYEQGHAGPFLKAFPDRIGGNHRARFGERNYACSTGWPSIHATHSGGDWLGLAATGKPVTMRVMDFWRREGAMLAENWVMIDIPDLLMQLGVDVFARMGALLPEERIG